MKYRNTMKTAVAVLALTASSMAMQEDFGNPSAIHLGDPPANTFMQGVAAFYAFGSVGLIDGQAKKIYVSQTRAGRYIVKLKNGERDYICTTTPSSSGTMVLLNESYKVDKDGKVIDLEKPYYSQIVLNYANDVSGLSTLATMQAALEQLLQLNMEGVESAKFSSGLQNPPKLVSKVDVVKAASGTQPFTLNNFTAEKITLSNSGDGSLNVNVDKASFKLLKSANL